MDNIYILCIEDQREVLHVIAHDLAFFSGGLEIEECETADEAAELLEEIDDNGDYVAVIVSDHVMPGKTGIDFLVDIHKDPRFRKTKKLLLTGLATHQDTINAINNAAIDRYIEKPWKSEDLVQYVRVLLTEYILDLGLGYEKYLKYLDQETLYRLLKQRG